MTIARPPFTGIIRLSKPSPLSIFAVALTVAIFAGCQTLPAKEAPKATKAAPSPAATPKKAGDGKSASAVRPQHGNLVSYNAFLRGLLAEIDGDTDKALLFMERAHEADPGSYEISMELLRVLMDKNDGTRTLALARELAAANPESAEAQYLLGMALAGGKDTTAALQAFKRSLEISPDDRDVYVSILMIASQGGKLDLAEDMLKSIAVRFPDEPLPRFSLGAIYAETKRWDEAVAEYERAARITPEMAGQARREIIRVYHTSGQTAKLAGVYRQMIREDPTDMEAQIGLIEAYLAAKDLESARPLVESLISAGKGDSAMVRTAGLLYYGAGYTDEAMKLFMGMAERPGATPEDWYFAAMAMEASGKKDEALAVYRRVTPGSRFYPNAQVSAAAISKAPGDRKAAYDAVEKATAKAGGGDPNLYIALAALFEDAKDFTKAESILKKALTEHENEPHLLFRLGVLYDRWGKKDEAIRILKQVVVLMPDSPEALNYLGYTYADLGANLPEAKELVEKALEIKPDEGAYIDSLGWVYFKMGDYAKAIELLKKAVDIIPDEPTLMEHLGDAYLATGESAKALALYEKALPGQEDPEVKKGLEKKIADLKKSGKKP